MSHSSCPQGLVSSLFLGSDVLTDWQIYSLDIDEVIASGWPHSRGLDLSLEAESGAVDGPVFYMGTLEPIGLAWDTFLKLRGWTKVSGTAGRSVACHAGFVPRKSNLS